jgi:ATP-dependent helicase/nuclease subunit A
MSAPDHGHAQRRASEPAASVFVTANAGSGKTTTLVDRVARLLLAGAEPGAILCVTYTKAAAAEMQRRLFERLGEWSVMADDDLRGQLDRLDGSGTAAGKAELSKARALFARALETPGGLKIQTIHAFCEKLLRRFPLEAEVSPRFQVMDDPAAAAVAAKARTRVARYALNHAGPVAEAYGRLSVALDFQSFQAMFGAFETRRAAIGAYVDACADVQADVWTRCGVAEWSSAEVVTAAALASLDRDLWQECAKALAQGGKTDIKCGLLMAGVAEGRAGLDEAFAALFTKSGEGDPATWPERTSAFTALPSLRAGLVEEQARLLDWREKLRAARIAEDTVMALVLAEAYVRAYELEKSAEGLLDFGDLVARTRDLLAVRADAAWVLYKLDGGIDHILVDEAQDTAPEQWAILRALTVEFFAGAGAVRLKADLERTLFIVGDEKQSIFSFQGADPDRLRLEIEAYREQIVGAGRRIDEAPLIASFRSTPEVLGFVDALFADASAFPGVPPPRGEAAVRHLATRQGDSGCVDLWPPEQESPGEQREAWDDPVDLEGPSSANRRLAEKIAAEIKGLIARGEAVFDKERRCWRSAHAGDVLILVRRRAALFEEILRALKRAAVPVAGADRLSLSQHIVFDDLLALARFIQFPGDDLTLAALLKSPLCGLGEEDLFALAHGRTRPLWAELKARTGERPAWREALVLLERARAESTTSRPFDLFARLLGWTDVEGRSVRARILTRLGAEAEDVLGEFLAQVLAAERRGAADMEQLAAALAELDIVVKREMDGARGEVRVMTVHGAKGLEAPIVFLPETTLKRGARGSPLLETEDGGFFWAASAKQDCAASAAARAWRASREDQEGQRLLYVALTRARDRLVLCVRINAKERPENIGGWYGAAETALARPEIEAQVRRVNSAGMEVRRFGPDPEILAPEPVAGAIAASLPDWGLRPAPSEAVERFASPSRLGEEPTDMGPAPSPLIAAGGLGRYRRGELVHRLLQLLPDLPAPGRAEAAQRMLQREIDLDDGQRAEIAAAALGVLEDERFAAVFGPGSRAEASIAGRVAGIGPVAGRVDRLLIEPDQVLVVDFKTNRPAPGRIEDADPAYILQMAVYGAVLERIFPGRRIEAALVWTDGPKLMPVAENLRAQALAGLKASVDSPASRPYMPT